MDEPMDQAILGVGCIILDSDTCMYDAYIYPDTRDYDGDAHMYDAEQHNLASYRRPQAILESYRWARIYKISRQKMPYLQICATKMPYLPIFATKMPYSHIFVSKIFGSIDMWQYVWLEHLRTLLGLVLL